MTRPAPAAEDLVTLLREVAQRDPTVDAFVDADGNRLGFADWDRSADGVAAGLADRGVGVGDVVCLVLPSSIEYMVCYQAVARLGAIVSGVNLRLGPAEVAHILGTLSPRVTITTDDAGALPPSAGSPVPWTALAEWTTAPPPPLPTLSARQALLVCWTGGTTGRPRGVVFDHDNLAAVAAGTGVLSAPYDRRLSPIPFPHVGTMTRAWDEISRRITTVITPAHWTAPAALSLVEREQVTVAQGVPTQWELMLRDPSFATTDRSSLRLAGIGGAAVSPELLERMRRALGVPVVNRYASTEAGGIISGTRPDDPDRVVVETVGRASDGVELRVVDDDGRPRPPGEVGTVQVRSGAVMRGYWDDPEGTAAAIDGEGWLTVGDLGSLDADGNLSLAGRTGDMYTRGGYNVYPIEVERHLAEHPGVAEVVVVAVPDELFGEIGVAVVVPAGASGAGTEVAPTLEELRAWLGDRVADYKAPDQLLVLDAMPLTAVGKIDRRSLVARAAGGQRTGSAA